MNEDSCRAEKRSLFPSRSKFPAAGPPTRAILTMRYFHQAHRSALLLGALSALVTLFVAPPVVHAAGRVLSSNATISGQLERVRALPATIHSRACRTRACAFRVPSIHLNVSVPGYKNVPVSLDRVIDPRFIVRTTDNQTLNDSSTRPLLLRGSAKLRHAGPFASTLTIPVAATLDISEKTPLLELTLRTGHPRTRSSAGFVTVRAHLADTPTSIVAARSRALSSFALDNLTCGTSALEHDTAEHHQLQSTGDARARASYDVLYMGTDFDSQWMTSVGCSSASACNNHILSVLNQASAFYEQQLGITFEVARQYGPTTHSSSTDSATLLYDFRAHNNDHRYDVIHNGTNVGDNLVDLFQLFTGRKMDQKVVGIAFTGVLCDNASSPVAHMVVSHKSSAADPVITAHEIGHTLNAGHTSSGIMTAVLSSALPSSFNSQSLAEINSYYAAYRSECRGGTGEGSPGSSNPADPTSPTPTPEDGAPNPTPETLKLTITKRGKDSYTVRTRVSVFRRGCAVSLRAGTTEDDAETGTIVFRHIPRSEKIVKRGKVSASIASSDTSGSTVYFTADYECPGNDLIEVSPFVSISPNSGGRASRKVSRRAWINLFNKAF